MTTAEIRNLETEKKIEYFRNILKDYNNSNAIDILNIYRLINSYNTFDDDFFNNPNSYICDISEFIDIKMSLEDEIDEFCLELVKWYLSMLASCDVKVETDQDEMVEIPFMIYGFFTSASIPVMSSIMNAVDMTQIDMGNLYKVKGAFQLMANLFRTQAFVSTYIRKF